jgi:hypothetical protein
MSSKPLDCVFLMEEIVHFTSASVIGKLTIPGNPLGKIFLSKEIAKS